MLVNDTDILFNYIPKCFFTVIKHTQFVKAEIVIFCTYYTKLIDVEN